ncbi:Peroxisomal N(1)-acetyl-spermine/spermidine oxidase [Auxenochlorella protothecoides]|uniref:Peroxisomal N(1)-acetyl-spermine/spermidine oxidase n=1 Tax=Auxenochlorella protothecoides TaxID=3075 RepID=A0A087SIB3_AUXPR|nr:Peroxisomal N(1)-acetyl-spermine/spermidine oxidase [Auxenochlorella protothecoides]KFM25467.1 Peroxisomal N(1)-acetyl-spermine/spermidine oxidase [Auxenochlorella protothecoides]RMZ54624.1 hypothetical protein APUTEX25_003002 [Auxenochlorella protothecoides]|eukprot:RMZ54624.1 hypothetical protein APUTEX25_003002 [Auxenochlorella protothecoides]
MSGVLIVGAGFAGLAAAQTLRRAGMSPVILLEAGSHVGGRARTLRLDRGLALEMGATWIHGLELGGGEGPNPVLRAAQRAQLLGARPRLSVWEDSHFLVQGASGLLTQEQAACIMHSIAAFEEGLDAAGGAEEGATLGDVLQAAWDKLSSGQKVAQHADLARRVWAWRESLQRAIDGTDCSGDLSATAAARYAAAVQNTNAPIPGGFQAVAEAMAEGLDVRLHRRVTGLDWGAEGGACATCEDGSRHAAAAAIVTVSLGVLKAQHETLFQPGLPARTRKAMAQLRMGTVDKLFLEFYDAEDSALDREDGAAPAAAPDLGNGADVVTYALLWDPASTASADSALPDWARGVFSIGFGGAEVKQGAQEPGASPRPVGVVWLAGEAARAVEAASDEEVLGTLRAVFRAFPGAVLPAGASWRRVRLHRSAWGSDPLFRGSYSYPGPSAAADAGAVLGEALTPPGVARPTLVLAGEACAVEYFGTTHGAMRSGEAAAAKLLSSL